ncbi:hypothetical protein [Magnetospirillum sp. LM-5]|uniref:hypothetical protein n=1 Tax=Magnetospirillum sp. LM-5 TaxID=2681466 RepID=UPI00156F572A|nr:hypothetical protein [Magnetospirillum sp. LM-5]
MTTSHRSACIAGAINVLLAGNVLAAPAEQGLRAPASFHRAESIVEKALDSILASADSDPTINNFILDRNGAAKRHRHLNTLFSNHYLSSARAVEMKMVKSDCGGTYLQGEVCGYNASALNCAQSNSELGYFFKTESLSDNRAIIVAAWGENSPPTSLYRLVLVTGRWVIDGVYCLKVGTNFNFK